LIHAEHIYYIYFRNDNIRKYKYKKFVIHRRRNIKNDKNKNLNSYLIDNDGCKDPIPLCVFDIRKNKKEQNERKKNIFINVKKKKMFIINKILYNTNISSLVWLKK